MIGFWAFMLIMDLLVPCVMIGCGWLFLNRPPREINRAFGYRTALSMRNQDPWQFAHHYCGKLWFRVGWILLPLSAVPLPAVFGEDVQTVGMVGGVVCFVQLIPMIGTVVLVEAALKRTFDRDGKRK